MKFRVASGDKMMQQLTLISVFLVGLVKAQTNQNYTHVSFYGDGYLRVAAQDARSDTDLLIEFRTSQTNALLFLAAGATDYCVVTLMSGSIRVRIDLGSGDATLQSQPGLVFNDFQWHVVRVIRRQAAVTLSIDGLYTVTATTPGRFFELNIDREIFVGGTGGTASQVYFGNYVEFRGCMRVVQFNGIDIINTARSLMSQSATAAYGVDWHCSSGEFSAASDRVISFISNTSFVAFPSLGQRRDVRLTFDLRSPSPTGVVLFNSGGHLDSDFIAVELVGGRVTLRVNKGAGAIVMMSLSQVDDGAWHQVEVFIDAVTIRLTVDGVRREERTSYGTARLLDVGTARLYLGGVGIAHRAAAVAARLDSLHGSGRAAVGSLESGCIQNFKIDGRLMGFREAVVTRSVRPDCVTSSTCQCTSGSCDDIIDPNDVRCLPGGGATVRQPDISLTSPSSGASSPSSSSLDQVVRVRDLVVREGGSSQLTEVNIDLAYSGLLRAALNASRDGAALRVVRPPMYGELFLTGTATAGGGTRSRPQQSTMTAAAATFTLGDVINGRILYVHDGSESTVDSFGLEIDLSGLTSGSSADDQLVLPEALRGRRKYAFSVVVQVAPWNDQPSLTLPVDDTLSIIAGTEIQLTPELLNATDADDGAASVEVSVQYQPGVDIGYFETADASGVRRARVTRFTQADLEANRVKFVHRGALAQQLKLQVSDGKDVGQTRILKVVATPLRVVYVANNGLVVPRGSSGIITASNLTFVTNAAAYQTIDVNYRVTEPPYDGELQRRQYNDDSWQVTSEFSQSHIDAGRLRYAHYGQSRSRGDYFRFRVSALGGGGFQGGGSGGAIEEHEFHVRVVDARVDVVRSTGLRFGGSRDMSPIGSDLLKATSTIPYHGPSDIVYRLVTVPRIGNLLRADESVTPAPSLQLTQRPPATGRVQRRKLIAGSVFTQADVNEGRLVYRLTKLPDSAVRDSFEFRVSAAGVSDSPSSSGGGTSTASTTFDIVFEPEADDQLRVINNGLMDVGEGQTKVIGSDDLWIERRGVVRVDYVVVEPPRNGIIEVVTPGGSLAARSNVTSFSSLELRDQRLRYRHDDSESIEDYFRFVATLVGSSPGSAGPSEKSNNEVSGTFEIKIVLRNDNAPVRVVDKPLYVVDGRGRVVTLDDIAFTDPDTDFDSSLLEYEWRDVTNGHVVHTENHAIPVHRFTQRDIADGIVYFRHRQGAGDADTTLWVTDGLLFATGLLPIRASIESFVRTGNGSAVVVDYGRRVALKPDNFGLVTNVDVSDRDLLFVIIVPPSHGTIRRSSVDRHRFSMTDVRAGIVTYEHAATNRTSSSTAAHFDTSHDDFRFSVHVGEVHTEGDVSIVIGGAPGSGSGNSMPNKQQQQQQLPGRRQQRLNIVTNHGLVVDALDSMALSPEVLNSSCAEKMRPVEILYTVTLTPRYGALTISGATVLRDLAAELRTFSQEDVNAGRVVYEHHEDQRYVDYFRFDVRCGDEVQRGIDFGFDVLPLMIPVEVSGNLTVRRFDSVYLRRDLFRLTRRQFEVPEIEFLIVRRPMYGHISVGDDVTAHPSYFTNESLMNGNVKYVCNMAAADSTGSVIVPPEVAISDSFVIIVRLASRDKQSQPKTVHINILPPNRQQPIVVHHRVLRVVTGSIVPFTSDELLVKDNDTSSDDIIYTLLTAPSNGDVIIDGKKVTNFTQKQINSGLLNFVHRGADRGSFQFAVSDGETELHPFTFEVETTPPLLSMSTCETLRVFPGVDQPITKSVLSAAVVNDPINMTSSRTLVYAVRQPPRNGRLRLVMSSPLDIDSNVDVTSFTQTEIDSDRIVYRPNLKSFPVWNDSIEDRVVLDVSTAYTEVLRNVTLSINVSYDNMNGDNLASLIVVGRLLVDEGGAATLTKSQLDATSLARRLADIGSVDVRFVVVSSPKHGRLAVAGGTNATEGYRLTQRDIVRNDIVYVHDGTDSVEDCIRFQVNVIATVEESLAAGNGNSETINKILDPVIELHVIVHAVDDQMFLLKTKSPNMTMLQGEMRVIRPEELLTVDADTTPDKIIYEVSAAASNGRLVNIVDREINETIERFSQKEIYDGKIAFFQDSSRESGAFYFKVSDGVHKPLYKVFNINVTQLTLTVSSIKDIIILQGDMSAVMDASIVSIETNGHHDRVFYNVTRPPAFGFLYHNDEIIQQFTHRNIVEGSIVYIQTELGTAVDELELSVHDVQNVVSGIKVKIVVKPRLKRPDHPFKVNGANRGQAVIGLNYLDASDLKLITGNDPIYYVITAPTKGRLEKRVTSRRTRQSSSTTGRRVKPAAGKQNPDSRKRKKGDSTHVAAARRPTYIDQAVLNFTHSDVVNGYVIYQSGLPPTEADLVLSDKFTFVLTSRNAQPVEETVDIAIASPPLVPTSAAPSLPDGAQSKVSASSGMIAVTEASDRVGRDHVLIVIAVAVLTTFVIVAIIVFKCIRRKREIKRRKCELAAVIDATPSTTAPVTGSYQSSAPIISPPPQAMPTVVQPEINKTGSVGRAPAPVRSKNPYPVPIIIEPPSSIADELPDYPSASELPQNTSAIITTPPMGKPDNRITGTRSPPTLPGADGPLPNSKLYRNGTPGAGVGRGGTDQSNTWKDQVTFDWQHVDPELLQHCRTTNPILHKNQYWV